MLKLSFRQQVFIGFAFAILLVLLVGFFSFRSIRQLEQNQTEMEASQQLITTSNHVLQLLIDAETGMRGFVATDKPVFLDPYHAALPLINVDLASLKEMQDSDHVQTKDLTLLSTLVYRQLDLLKSNIDNREKMGLDAMVKQNILLNGKQVMDSIRSTIIQINERELRSLAARKKAIGAAVQFTIITIIGGSTIFFFIILGMLYYILGTFRKQKVIEHEIIKSNADLAAVLKENEDKNWLLTGGGILSEKMQGQQSEAALTQNVLAEICSYSNAVTGTLYLYDEKDELLKLSAWYAFHDLSRIKKTIELSESWVGQVAHNNKAATIKGTLNQRLELETSIVSQELAEVFIVPLFFDKHLVGVIEVAYQDELTNGVKEYIQAVSGIIGVAINTARARAKMQDLFEETQQQAEELESQQEEMRVTNEELLSKTEMLQASEEELRVQQEELRTINAELKEKAIMLEEKNQAVELARKEIGEKVTQLETTGRYKSEFLANMSHELRTPLNSILVLARILKDNKPDNLSADQIKYASVIFNAGNDLLTLINDILDLAKIESGKLELQNERTSVDGIVADMEMLFAEVATNKKITFTKDIGSVPDFIVADKMRVEQVLKNLLSNAFKFTPAGGEISIKAMPGAVADTIAFSVKDSGIGIQPDKQKLIFEAFQQEDGSTSRKYGGTGLGLSISRELAALLGGSINLFSEPGKGSEFTFNLPVTASEVNANQDGVIDLPTIEEFTVQADMPRLAVANPTDPNKQPLVIIVEDDHNFAEILQNYAAEYGYKSILINEGTHAAQTIADNKPDAVILDIMLPGKDGWAILKELKNNPETKTIPVHMMSAGEAAAKRVQNEGAISFMKKPINTEALNKLFGDIIQQQGHGVTEVLLIEDQEVQSNALKELMEKQGIGIAQAFTGESAFQMLQNNEYQCVILDLNLPDISGLDLLDKIKAIDRFASLPIIINTAMELDKSSVARLMQYANAMVVKTSKSSDRLIDEVNLFLHKLNNTDAATQAAATPRLRKMSQGGKPMLMGKKVLLVDDDMRNIFALSSALQTYGLEVEIANDGQEALEQLENITGIDIVLMDIMMPKMDGYEAMKQIRKQNKWAKLPIIALTAKAMKDDHEKCIAAGANDYITKPVDIDRLISLMQMWIES